VALPALLVIDAIPVRTDAAFGGYPSLLGINLAPTVPLWLASRGGRRVCYARGDLHGNGDRFGGGPGKDTQNSPLLSSCYIEIMSVNVSVRLDDTLAERLRLRARAAGETVSERLRRYAEEGSRRDEHPLITFRDGPAGRRAAVVGGPDVWEIVMWLQDVAEEQDPARILTAEQGISRSLIDAALRYGEAYPDEIDARIALHRHDTAAADAK
jgi:hypothetical protein